MVCCPSLDPALLRDNADDKARCGGSPRVKPEGEDKTLLLEAVSTVLVAGTRDDAGYWRPTN